MSTREYAYSLIDSMTEEQLKGFILLFGSLVGSEEVPNEETLQAMLEAEKIAYDPTIKSYTDVHEMFEEILNDDE